MRLLWHVVSSTFKFYIHHRHFLYYNLLYRLLFKKHGNRYLDSTWTRYDDHLRFYFPEENVAFKEHVYILRKIAVWWIKGLSECWPAVNPSYLKVDRRTRPSWFRRVPKSNWTVTQNPIQMHSTSHSNAAWNRIQQNCCCRVD